MQDHSHSHSQTAIDHALAQIVGIGILEFGVVLHSFLIGLTLAVDEQFKILFVVLVFHREPPLPYARLDRANSADTEMFEGLGLGSRLAQLRLPPRYRLIPIAGAVLYGVTTPLGIAVGLGIRTTYNPEGTTASIVAGIMDSLCAGILLYTGLVELLAHEFLFNPQMSQASNKRVAFASVSLISGAALMALLGRWA
jgi:zinc transporter 1/2/3